MTCENCKIAKAILVRPKNKVKVCKECFYDLFEEEIHHLIVSTKMFKKYSKVGIGISGGKDSTVLAYVMKKLNDKYKYNLELVLLCIDEGIDGYRDRSIETVLENQRFLGLELKILSYKDIFNITMDEVVQKIGKSGNCTYCGVFRRQSLETAARIMNVDYIVTGHNADDMAETVILNLIRGDISRLRRCTMSKTLESIITDEDSQIKDAVISLSRCKPFKYSYQKEIVLYAYYKKLKYFSTECTYAPGASRGDTRALIKELEKLDSSIILNIIKSGEDFMSEKIYNKVLSKCQKCNHPTSSEDKKCVACGMIAKLSQIQICSSRSA